MCEELLRQAFSLGFVLPQELPHLGMRLLYQGTDFGIDYLCRVLTLGLWRRGGHTG